eukprot:804987_1
MEKQLTQRRYQGNEDWSHQPGQRSLRVSKSHRTQSTRSLRIPAHSAGRSSDISSTLKALTEDKEQSPNALQEPQAPEDQPMSKSEKVDFMLLRLKASLMASSVLTATVPCWLNNSVPDMYVGKANGMGQTLSAFVKGFGPLLTGFIWSESITQIQSGTHYAVYYAYLPVTIILIPAIIDTIMYIPSDLQLTLTWQQRQEENTVKNNYKQSTDHKE